MARVQLAICTLYYDVTSRKVVSNVAKFCRVFNPVHLITQTRLSCYDEVYENRIQAIAESQRASIASDEAVITAYHENDAASYDALDAPVRCSGMDISPVWSLFSATNTDDSCDVLDFMRAAHVANSTNLYGRVILTLHPLIGKAALADTYRKVAESKKAGPPKYGTFLTLERYECGFPRYDLNDLTDVQIDRTFTTQSIRSYREANDGSVTFETELIWGLGNRFGDPRVREKLLKFLISCMLNTRQIESDR